MSEITQALARILPPKQVITDSLRRLAYGTDASFYRLTPEVVVVVESEEQVQALLQAAQAQGRPVTFRAAGTSLSGQAVTDSVLVLIGEGFATCEIGPDAVTVRVGPGIIGGEVNYRLAPFGRKIGPDPASINACKIGGIAANNASGMCCGTAQNSYRTLAGMRVILADGAVLDTENPFSVARFQKSHASLLDDLHRLGTRTRGDETLAARIRHKYKIKNTTGYSLNALLDFEDPVQILAHLMIGSEGTLGFISRITYQTVVEDPFKASALVFFPSIESACQAVIRLKTQPVSAVELLDRPALRSVQDKPGLPPVMRSLSDDAAALLIEVRAQTAAALQLRINASLGALTGITTVGPATFSTDPATCDMYWKVRKGTFPSVGAVRRTGTTVIIEDVAFPLASLAAATLDLQALLRKHGYLEGIIFGHALEGNLHFVFTQDFSHQAEIDRYARFMEDVCTLVVDKYDGSLKAEHGTGRNMAPFVEREWGTQATDLMRRIKQLFDPQNLLNPGVILNDDPQAHLKNLKPMPAAEELVDRCIECGFCEPLCPSHQLTLSPRQRIVSWRELSRRTAANESVAGLDADFAYYGLDTCASCGLCSTACPVGIDTGALTRLLRGRGMGNTQRKVAQWTVGNFGKVATASRLGIGLGHVASSVVGDGLLARLSGGKWKRGMPQASKVPEAYDGTGDPVVYFPACGGRIFGANAKDEATLPEVIMELLVRAGYAPRLPQGFDKLCCGQMLESKGMAKEADAMADAVTQALLEAADNGQGGFYPVIMDASTCSVRMQKKLASRLELLDFHEFAHDALLPRLRLSKKAEPIALHINCSVRRTASDAKLRAVLAACAEQIVEPAGVSCCGFGGDRGFVVPELNVHALRRVHEALPSNCCEGVSTNRTCEIGLTAETGRPYHSIAYLLEECSRVDTINTC
ncbi:MAG: FAD-binding oxidoreductase [Gammaproteobacteria bacterium]|uniref:FAD-binding and (Fe-S)-binding domain-containing protein n=1 Tax=Rhodoferax sp. TaxID=50421 RepID=UPI00184DEED5|nr:FAD-binding and (Fe-S)-binding domain-containing protein [Rhodoferax sp.]MBU3897440.1 FAD-binding oxidoreductase [Gammaproteobacteria bacterium]MBA3056938.1 FAD-binding oxidoreductase [Rhodoferax sp.]MBU3998487.1 FAD-binding oxidoreductase [Gammaproteobacteria bacterium]MBU4018786.1 FAD-binding oxidoreductase [Gammaproteobacteria bacterium]MBU4079741.1 FAD-binding oxidoreductase [Gammaproteobacteria bacterium]